MCSNLIISGLVTREKTKSNFFMKANMCSNQATIGLVSNVRGHKARRNKAISCHEGDYVSQLSDYRFGSSCKKTKSNFFA